MKLLSSNFKFKAAELKLIFIFIGFVVGIYCLLIHFSLCEWHQLKKRHLQLKHELNKLSHKSDSTNPLQHDPLIHVLIKYAQENQVEITNTRFSKAQNNIEEFSCELLGSYPNTLRFIKMLFSSSYILALKDLSMASEHNAHYLKTQLVFKRYV